MLDSNALITLLNRYYFEEFVPQLPEPLQALATNPYVLYHRGVEGTFTEVTLYVMEEYWVMPWLLNDIFGVDDEQVLALNRAYLLLFLSYLVQDHLADLQAPDTPLVPLFAHHLHLVAAAQLRQLLGDNPTFWRLLDESVTAHTVALSIEHQSLVLREPPLDMAQMQTIAAGKAMPFHIATAALACLSQKEARIAPLQEVFKLYLLADQLYDDVEDYEEDWHQQRATIIFVKLAEATQQPLHTLFQNMDQNMVTAQILAHAILEESLAQSTELFQHAFHAIPAATHKTRLQSLLEKRMAWNNQRLNAIKGVRLFRRLRTALES